MFPTCFTFTPCVVIYVPSMDHNKMSHLYRTQLMKVFGKTMSSFPGIEPWTQGQQATPSLIWINH